MIAPTPAGEQTAKAGMRYRDRLRAEVSSYAPGAAEEVLAFRREMYGSSSIYGDRAYLDWMYGEPRDRVHPRGLLWLHRKSGKVEGQLGGLKVTLEVGGRAYPALWALDLMVSPQYQMRGIGVVLADAAFDETGLTLGTEVSDDACRAFIRAGWSECGRLPLYVRPLDLSRIVRARWSHQTAAMFGAAAGVGVRTLDRALLAALRVGGVRLERVQSFDERSDKLWKAVSGYYPVACRRDSSFLNWRFATFPADRYRMYYAFHRREFVGHLVLRHGEWNGLPAGFIVDFTCAPQWTTRLLGAALSEFRQASLAAAYCLHLNPVSTRPLSALGFVRRDSGWRFMLRANALSQELRSMMCDQRSWFLTAADSDLDRPREGTVFTPTASWTNTSSAITRESGPGDGPA